MYNTDSPAVSQAHMTLSLAGGDGTVQLFNISGATGCINFDIGTSSLDVSVNGKVGSRCGHAPFLALLCRVKPMRTRHLHEPAISCGYTVC